MIDREKVAEALECYRMNPDPVHCEEKDCPYNNNDTYYGYWCCTNSILYDAVRLLKEQAEEIRELREELIDMSTNGGTGNQREVCKYLLFLMDAIEERQRRARDA